MINASDFKVPGYLRSAHLQTMLNSQGPRKWRARRILQRLESTALELVAGDGWVLGVLDTERFGQQQYGHLFYALWRTGCDRLAWFRGFAHTGGDGH